MTSVVENVEEFRNGWWKREMIQPVWNTTWQFQKNLNMDFSYNPAILLLGNSTQKEMKTHMHLKSIPNNRIHNSPQVETAQKSILTGTDKQSVIYPHNGIVFSNKKVQNTDEFYGMEDIYKHYTLSRKSDTRNVCYAHQHK